MDDPKIWNSVLSERRQLLEENLDARQFGIYLRGKDVIVTKSEYQILQTQKTPEEQFLYLFNILQTRVHIWKPLLEYLDEGQQRYIADELRETYNMLEKFHKEATETEKAKPDLTDPLQRAYRGRRGSSPPFRRLSRDVDALVKSEDSLVREAVGMDDPKIWNSVISQCTVFLQENLNLDEFSSDLKLKGIITQLEYESLLKERTSKEKFIYLLKNWLSKDEFWKPLLEYLDISQRTFISTKLRKTYQELAKQHKESSEAANSRPDLTSSLQGIQEDIRSWIRDDPCQRIFQSLVPNTNFSDIHVDAVIQSPSGSTDRTIQDGDYSYIWETPGSRIVIEGDPGTGKSTYLCNLALSWANDHPELKQRFDFVIYISLGSVEEYYIEELVREMTEDQAGLLENITTIFNREHRDRVLLLLDGFDEFNVAKNKEIEQIIQFKRFQSVKTIISTRPSHTISIEKRHLTLFIKGFSDESAKDFIRKLGLEEAEMQELLQIRDNFPEYSKNPLILTCLALIVMSKNYLQLKDNLYTADGFAMVIENLLKNLIRKKFVILIEGTDFEQLFWDTILELGPLAVEKVMLDEAQKRVISCYEVIEPPQKRSKSGHSELCERSGLVFQRRFLVCGSVEQTWEFIHQIVAEFAAAHYLANLCERDAEFSAKFTQSFFPQFIQTPLFYFLSKFSIRFQEAAIQEMSKSDHRCAPRFARIRTTVKCSGPHSRSFTSIDEWSIIECLKVMEHNIYSVWLDKCRIGRSLPAIFELCKWVHLKDCEIGACCWNQEVAVVETLIIVWKCSFSNPTSFAQVLSHLDSLEGLTLELHKFNDEVFQELVKPLSNLKFAKDVWKQVVSKECRIERSLPAIFGLFEKVTLENCEIGDCCWNQEVAVVERLEIWGKCSFSDPSSFAQVLSHLNSCTILRLWNKIQGQKGVSYLHFMESLPCLKEVELWWIKLTDDSLQDWLETGSPLKLMDKIEFETCDFGSLSRESFARMGTKLHTKEITFGYSTLPKTFTYLVENSSNLLNSSMKKFRIEYCKTTESSARDKLVKKLRDFLGNRLHQSF